MNESVLTFSHISFKYHTGTHIVLRDVSFDLKKGSFTVIIGPSGCGKSTVLKICAGLNVPTEGDLSLPQKKGMVFQSGALLPWFSALDNVMLALEGDGTLSLAEKKHRSLAALETMRMKEFADTFPRELSGGQRQRIGIARALVAEPELLLLDEPFSALDPETTEALHAELLEIWKARGITVLMVSHSLDEAIMLGERIMVMHEGRILKDTHVNLPYPRDNTDEKFVHYVSVLRKELKEERMKGK
jgi:NitT/TauT family transport system ATP-binding protein